MKISLYESFPWSVFTPHYWAYTGEDLPHGQGSHSPLLALPVQGTLRTTCSVLSTALQLLPHQFTCYFHIAHWASEDSLFAPHSRDTCDSLQCSLLSNLLIEQIIANLACVTQEQLMETTAFPSILLSFFSCTGECQQLSSTVDFEAW